MLPENPFSLFTPVQKAMLYRVLISYKSKTESTIFALSTYPSEIDDMNLMVEIAGFQIEHVTQLMALLEQNISVDELAILPYITQSILTPNPVAST